MTTKPDAPTPPSPYFQGELNGHPPIFMSYGLLNRLSLLVGDPTKIDQVYLDADLQALMVSQALGKFDESTQTFQPAPPETIMISPITAVQLISWMVEHLLDFFLQSLAKAKTVSEKYESPLKAFQSSPGGTVG